MEENSEITKGWKRFKRLKVQKGTFKRHARKIESATLKHAHRFLVRRWSNVRDVGRSTIAWLLTVGALIGLASTQFVWFSNAYTTLAPAEGGTYAEGIVGRVETINPLFASSAAELSASKLIFSGLLDYDQDNQLRPDAAKSWAVSPDGKVYTVTLRTDIYWHDGEKMTVDDVLFTVGLMQNEVTRSQQYGNWAGVKAEKVADSTITFTLPSIYAPFAHSLTFGILPKHILEKVKPVELRENEFGRKPVGSGPFVFRRIQLIDPSHDRLVVHLDTNTRYYKKSPALNRFQIHTYEKKELLQKALQSNEVSAVLGLAADQIAAVTKNSSFVASKSPLADGMFAIFNNDSLLLKDVQLRQILVQGTNRSALISKVQGRGVGMEGPLPAALTPGWQLQQQPYKPQEAAAKLDAAGWKLTNGVRMKDNIKLELSIVTPNTGDYPAIVEELAKQWEALGVGVKVQVVATEAIVSDYLRPRNYDVLVYELAVGADPDIYPYWHSSQIKPSGLNLANYRSGLADDALASARGRQDASLRLAKYKTFYEQWLKDAPAVALYQPLLSYVSDATSTSLENNEPVTDTVARFRAVERWSVSKEIVLTTP